jgi:hypothetical protein
VKMLEISIAAANFVASYAAAMALGADRSKSIDSVAEALASHYAPSTPFTAFTLGHVTLFPDRARMNEALRSYLLRLYESGLGMDIFMDKHRIEAVSSGSALCWITWAIRPKDGTEGWAWENVYGYRRPVTSEEQEQQGHWEFVVSDQEIAGMLQYRPSVMRT